MSFGFLDQRASQQPKDVLKAVRDSKGVYATITVAEGSINYVNYVLLNGLAYQDNPQGAGDRLMAGLASTQFISGSTSVSMKYFAEQGEKANFTLVSFTSDTLDMEARMNGQSLNTTKGLKTSRKFIEVTPPATGDLEVIITASNSPVDGLFSVLTGSTAPIKNCTVGVTRNTTGLSTGAKAGIGIGAAVAVLAMAAAATAAYKHLHAGGNTTSAPAGTNTTGPTLGYGETTGYHPGGEKLGPETTHSSIPTNHTGGGFEGNLTGQAPNGPMGPPPNGSMPLSGAPGVPYSAVPPFMPPLMPPPMSQNNTGKDSPSQNTGYEQPYGPGNQYQQNLGGHNGYMTPGGDPYNHTGSPFQGNHTGTGGDPYNHTGSPFQHSGVGADPYNHTGSPFQGNSTNIGTPFSDANTTSSPYSSPNHTNFDSGNHTNWSTPGDTPTPGAGPGVGPGHPNPPQPFFQMPSAPSWQSQTRHEQRKHHHHEWLAPDMACEHPDCPLIANNHQCAPSKEACVCLCRDGNCPVTRRGG